MVNRTKATVCNFIGLFACCGVGATLGRMSPFDTKEWVLIGFISLFYFAVRTEQVYVVRDAIDQAKRVVADVLGTGEPK